ncbi:hypothetical protein F5X68DRAFT_202837 [Plectosphaerella plurivora]|uniref:Uncharacterized protein n=1 Tax=Plectosphaerella plurivora TaxID=936078 RepID=A0A9P8VEE9_9PEZI|nr:hypothetical protein F5X68DRAFT_202837 [Plectosphaerella plurivora]
MSEHGLEEGKKQAGPLSPRMPRARLEARPGQHGCTFDNGDMPPQAQPFASHAHSLSKSHRLGLDLGLDSPPCPGRKPAADLPPATRPLTATKDRSLSNPRPCLLSPPCHPRTGPPISSPDARSSRDPSVHRPPSCPVLSCPKVFGTMSDTDRNPACQPPDNRPPPGPRVRPRQDPSRFRTLGRQTTTPGGKAERG